MHFENSKQTIKLLAIILEKGRQNRITKQLIHSFSVNIGISQPSKEMFTSASPRYTLISRVDKS